MPRIPISTLREWMQVLDPAEALDAGDPRYVNLDEGPGARRGSDSSAIDDLERAIELSIIQGRSCQIFTGFPGSGKTTELKRLEARLSASEEPTHVLWLDIERYLDPFCAPDITDLLRVLAFCLEQEALRIEGADPDAPSSYLERVLGFLRSEVVFKGPGIELPGLKLMLELRDNPDLRRQLRDRLARDLHGFSKEARKSMNDSLERIRRRLELDRVVLLVDGLEKIQSLRVEDAELTERAVETLFLQHHQHLAIPCHVVYTFPFWLRWQTAQLGQKYSSRPVVLPMTRVRSENGEPFAPGQQLMETLASRRMDLRQVFGERPAQALEPIIHASGGFPRDLLRLLRDLLVQSKAFPVTPDNVSRTLQRLSEEYEMVALREGPELFSYIARHRALPMGEHNFRAIGRLVQKYLVLTYRNGHEWYDLHPLVASSPRVQQWMSAAEK